MNLSFDARIEGSEIACSIGSDTALAAPVWCFSLHAPGVVVAGGSLVRRLGGYTEIALPDIAAGGAVAVTIRHENPAFTPRNRAWLPLGGYLRLADGRTMPLPVLPAGVIAEPVGYPPCEGLRLVPPPIDWQGTGGTVTLAGVASDHPVLASVAALAMRCGMAGFVVPGGVPVTIAADPAQPPEGYVLRIGTDCIEIAAATDAGIFHAGITLLTLRRTHAGAVPCGTITDAPRFGWRGQMLDCARHFFGVDTIERLLDLMALLKLNRFHWHFADDEAYRLETETTPDLWQKTAFRGEGLPVPGVFGGGIRSGGSYSRADVSRILARAGELHIGVLPEIEVPAHAMCLNAVLPGLRDPGDNGVETSVQGYADNSVNPAMPATWDVLKPLAAEVASMFPLGILHIGGDELAPGTWDTSPAASALKAREGLVTRDDLQGWTMAHLAGDLAAQGIRCAAWEEASRGCQGGIGHDALIFSWTGQGAGVEAARRGHDVVMCPGQHAYLDMAHTEDPADWGAVWAAILPLEQTVEWHPVPRDAPDIAGRVVGVQGTFWGEFTCADVEMEAMLAPRILGIACKGWEVDGTTTGARLRALAGAYAGLFDTMGWQRHVGA